MKTLYKLSFLLIFICLGITSCSDNNTGFDYSSPDLDLIVSNIEDERAIQINETTTLDLTFKNAEGEISYIWTIDGGIISKDDSYTFKAEEPGIYTLNVYAQDSSEKYVNKSFIIKVLAPPHVFDTNKVVVGYFPNYRRDIPVQWDKITHLIYTFVYPKADGTLDTSEMAELSTYITLAKENNVKILVSVGGAAYPGKDVRIFTDAIVDETKRANLVSSINDFVRDNELDGIDIDYEELQSGGATVDNTEANKLLPLFKELREALPNTSLITAAVTGGYGWAAYHFRDITAEMSEELDFISVMSYDNLGTWGGSPLGDHSSVTDGIGALARYVEFGAPSSKLVLGLPFYGRDFLTANGGFAAAITYNDIITTYAPTSDEFTTGNINRDGHNIFFNSQETISQKVNHVKDTNYRGITIWELGQNTDDPDLNLLKDILNQF